MNVKQSIRIIAGLFLCLMLSIPMSQAEQNYTDVPNFNPNATCGDYLKQLDPHAPDYFAFIECKYESNVQGKPYTVIYTFNGQYAEDAEQYLHTKYKVDRFKFLCCRWESQYESGQYVAPNTGYRYHFRVVSEETLSDNIIDATFYMSISLDTEEI